MIVPAYNEEDRLGVMIDEAMEYFLAPATGNAAEKPNGISGKPSRREEGVEILVVDDGSTDGTSRVGRELSEKWEKKMKEMGIKVGGGSVEIRVVGLKKNRGKGGAVQHVSDVPQYLDVIAPPPKTSASSAQGSMAVLQYQLLPTRV